MNWNTLLTTFYIMATTKLDITYSAFISNVIPLMSQMNKDELEDLLFDITAKIYTEIDRAEETKKDFMDEQRSDNTEEKEVYDDDNWVIL